MCIRDSKKIMFDRINYMIDNNYIRGNTEHYKDYSDIVRKSEIMKGLALKYNFTKTKTTLENMQDPVSYTHLHPVIYIVSRHQ